MQIDWTTIYRNQYHNRGAEAFMKYHLKAYMEYGNTIDSNAKKHLQEIFILADEVVNEKVR